MCDRGRTITHVQIQRFHFIPRYEKINATIWMCYGTLASASTTAWRRFYENILAGTLVALLYLRNTSQMLVDLHSIWVWDLLVTRQSWFENGNISSNSRDFIRSWIGAQSADKCPIHERTCLKDLSLANFTARPYYDPLLTKPNQYQL